MKEEGKSTLGKIKMNEVVYKEPDHGQIFLSASLETEEKGEKGTEGLDISGSGLTLKRV